MVDVAFSDSYFHELPVLLENSDRMFSGFWAILASDNAFLGTRFYQRETFRQLSLTGLGRMKVTLRSLWSICG